MNIVFGLSCITTCNAGMCTIPISYCITQRVSSSAANQSTSDGSKRLSVACSRKNKPHRQVRSTCANNRIIAPHGHVCWSYRCRQCADQNSQFDVYRFQTLLLLFLHYTAVLCSCYWHLALRHAVLGTSDLRHLALTHAVLGTSDIRQLLEIFYDLIEMKIYYSYTH
jgi:hypothetical protein